MKNKIATAALLAGVLLSGLACAAAPAGSGGTIQTERGDALRYVVEGQGQPVLVVGSSVYYPRTFSDGLKKKLEMYFLDLPWFVANAKTGITLDTVAADIEHARKTLELAHVVVIGHSVHGNVAYEYAKRHPKQVSRLVMVNSFTSFGNQEYSDAVEQKWATASEERVALQDANWQNYDASANKTYIDQVVADYQAMSPKYWYDAKYDARWLWAGTEVNEQNFTDVFAKLFANYSIPTSDGAFPVPTLAFVGEYDYVLPAQTWDRLAHTPNLTLVKFDRSGHTVQMEEPARFDQTLLGWLARKPVATKAK